LTIDKESILDTAQKFVLKGQLKKAIHEYLKLVEADPQDKRLHLKLGDLYIKNGEEDKAIQAYLKVATLYGEEDLNFRAISIYKKILSINPKFTEAFHKIAILYLKEGLAGNAKNYYQSILQINPRDSAALNKNTSPQPAREGRSPPRLQPPPSSDILRKSLFRSCRLPLLPPWTLRSLFEPGASAMDEFKTHYVSGLPIRRWNSSITPSPNLNWPPQPPR
jgi:tetratricopeptide (TPR) repeat protein